MSNLNTVQLIGRLGQDPEMRSTAAGDAVANLSIATSEKWKDKQGNPQESTEWHRCVAFKRTAEVCGEYLTKGQLVYVEGRIATRKWQDQSGQDRYTTEIKVDRMQMLGGRADSGAAGQRPPAKPQQERQAAPQTPPPADFGDFDDDIPF